MNIDQEVVIKQFKKLDRAFLSSIIFVFLFGLIIEIVLVLGKFISIEEAIGGSKYFLPKGFLLGCLLSLLNLYGWRELSSWIVCRKSKGEASSSSKLPLFIFLGIKLILLSFAIFSILKLSYLFSFSVFVGFTSHLFIGMFFVAFVGLKLDSAP